jgi:ribosomal protein S18 acetylase RimI-like enzyme
LFKVGGLGVFLHQLRRQLYLRSTFLRLEKNLEDGARARCSVKYSLNLATKEDMQEVLQRAKAEGDGSVHDLLQRNWFYECGFHNCYIARINDNGEICHLAWLVFPDEESIIEQNLGEKLIMPEKDKCVLENAYTFTRYRRKGLMSSVIIKLSELAKSQGYKRMIAYVREDNLASLKACKRAGFKQCGEDVHQVKLFLFTRMRHGSRRTHGEDNCFEVTS